MPRSADSLARRAMFRVLGNVRHGRLELIEPGGRKVFGQTRFEGPLTATVTVNDPHFYSAFFRGSLGLAESYVAGEWDCDDLPAFVAIGARNMPALDRARAIYRLAERPARAIGAAIYDPPGTRRAPRATTTSATTCSRAFSTRRWPTRAASFLITTTRWPRRRARSSTVSAATCS